MITDILQDKKVLFADGAATELRAQVNRRRVAVCTMGNLTGNLRADEKGVCARVFKNGVYGFSSAAELSGEAAEKVLKEATLNADFMGTHVPRPQVRRAAVPSGAYTAPHDIRDNEQKLYVDTARRLDEYLTSRYPDLVSHTVRAYEDSQEKLLVTSDGCDAHILAPRSYVYIFMTAQTPQGQPVELFEAVGGEGTFDVNFRTDDALHDAADRIYENLMKKREGVFADAGEKTVILGGIMTGMLSHEAVGHTVEADIVKGGSVAGHLLGQQVASEKVSLTDFAHTAFGARCPLPVFADDEGTLAADAPLIRDGILTGYMNSRESAAAYGRQPLGNARAWAFSDEPLIRMRNTAIHPGTDKLEDMIASVDDGYYLLSSTNGQADTTGEFMFGVSLGYEIKHGKLGRALLDTTVSGVAFDMLKTVDMVSDEVIWSSSGFCGKKQPMPVGMGGPALRCRIRIGGR